MSYQIGTQYVRKSIAVPPGTLAQRMAWAEATPGPNLAAILRSDRVYVWIVGRFGLPGPLRLTNTEFDRDWERA